MLPRLLFRRVARSADSTPPLSVHFHRFSCLLAITQILQPELEGRARDPPELAVVYLVPSSPRFLVPRRTMTDDCLRSRSLYMPSRFIVL